MHLTLLLRVHRARLCARVILLPLLAAVTVLATAVTAQGMPIKAAARGHSLALAASRPPRRADATSARCSRPVRGARARRPAPGR